ncbi:potassium channel tetramerisation domain containing protein, putative [Perkinsus marinus ATCC 50983]|uniref:Potassium channel tetramerisation domain containing protein, putative n=1 Tax=Perkinsus marinus (strain ATCC 50983 / TXsc) TaxID=423536 RepID=C5KYC3_PERM5|nr:potassium channel tetramerisation domain containing protein, putative [Perkinsus marinus ATCC 50983]EER10500.1 potassium channel tetramerisation domain containing protein, putative [Perkinsus marinus ATCC 50983]|eukprot:XP_002778705.1 potassium channel tetramerisation domain containing protein, putative [Perkinsus marinus ATCC 50983]
MTSSLSSDVITLSVGGKIYQVTKSTLDKYPDTMLSRMVSEDWKMSKNDSKDDTGKVASPPSVFIDRDGALFEYILNWYRNGEICIPWTVSEEAVRREASYFALPDDVRVVRDTILNNVREAVGLVLDDVREKIAKCQTDKEEIDARYSTRLAQLQEEKRMLKAQREVDQNRIRRDAMTFEILLPILTQTAAVICPMVAITCNQVSRQTVTDIRSSTREELADLGDIMSDLYRNRVLTLQSLQSSSTFCW